MSICSESRKCTDVLPLCPLALDGGSCFVAFALPHPTLAVCSVLLFLSCPSRNQATLSTPIVEQYELTMEGQGGPFGPVSDFIERETRE